MADAARLLPRAKQRVLQLKGVKRQEAGRVGNVGRGVRLKRLLREQRRGDGGEEDGDGGGEEDGDHGNGEETGEEEASAPHESLELEPEASAEAGRFLKPKRLMRDESGSVFSLPPDAERLPERRRTTPGSDPSAF